MKKYYLKICASGLVTLMVLCAITTLHTALAASQTLTTGVSAANLALGTTDQTDAFATSTANTAQVKATRTLIISTTTLPIDTDAFTIGTCVVTFATSTPDDTNCNGGATIRTNLGTDLAARTKAQLATAILGLNATSTAHGALTATASSTDTSAVVFTTTGTEISATTINFTDNSALLKIASPSYASISGVVPVAEILTITITGTVDVGDVYSISTPSLNSGSAVTYTVQSTDTTTTDIATGINAALQAATGYGSTLTSTVSTNTVIITAATAGTGFNISTNTTNRSAVAQVVTFTPGTDFSVEGYTFTITINGTDYTGTGSTLQALVDALSTAADADSAVSCTNNDVLVTCTASSAGTAFTYGTSVVARASGNSGGGGGGHSSVVRRDVTPTPSFAAAQIIPISITYAPYPAATPVPGSHSSYMFTAPLSLGSTGAGVRELQLRLTSEGVYHGPITGYYGPLTTAGVKAFQKKYSIDQVGIVGPMTRARLNQ